MTLKTGTVGNAQALRLGAASCKLRLVESLPYYREEVRLAAEEPELSSHSLHQVVAYPHSMRAEVAGFLVRKYSKRSSIVLDPFCGSGTTGLEANMLGRVAFLSDVNPLAVAIARPKLDAADLAEVTLGLQAVSLRRPVEMGPYGEVFKHFFEAETFREVVNLRAVLASKEDRVSNFIRLIALSLLHGASAGYFSVYTYPNFSSTPQQQAQLNVQRRQVPDYRAVLPRILRKTASALRDGIPSVMRQISVQNRVDVSDARNLSYIPSACVDLAVAAPPLPGAADAIKDQWLRLWFLGIQAQPLAERLWQDAPVDEWLSFMNETLTECARVVKGGGRACFVLRDTAAVKGGSEIEMRFIDMVQRELPRYWGVECVLVNREKASAVTGIASRRSPDAADGSDKIVVLRRQ